MDISIAIATHKKYQMPNDNIYLPILVGADFNTTNVEYQKDNIGDHISDKNLNFCELTSMYWLWKNDDSNYKGISHYRRHFSDNKKSFLFSTGKFSDVLREETLVKLLETSDIVLPKKRNYYVETIESHYNHTHYEIDLKITRDIINEICPEYLQSYDEILSRKSAHMFNMFIMKDEYYNSYCEWLFEILFELENRLDITEYSPFHQRVFGRVSEILLDVWIENNKLSYVEVPVIFMEKQSWTKKGLKFFSAKFLSKRY